MFFFSLLWLWFFGENFYQIEAKKISTFLVTTMQKFAKNKNKMSTHYLVYNYYFKKELAKRTYFTPFWYCVACKCGCMSEWVNTKLHQGCFWLLWFIILLGVFGWYLILWWHNSIVSSNLISGSSRAAPPMLCWLCNNISSHPNLTHKTDTC
jgi:hypothetical protein